jgi:hypothetical protein
LSALKQEILVAANVLSLGETVPEYLGILGLAQTVQYAMCAASTQGNFQTIALVIALTLSSHIEAQPHNG